MNESRKAFVLMPFKEPYNSYYPAIFKPGLQAAGFDDVSRADDLFTPRPVMLDIQQSIIDADLVLCDMSERNPNVFYELGICHTLNKPVLLLAQSLEDVPFDVRHLRVLLYDYTPHGCKQLERDLEAHILALLEDLRRQE